MRYLLLLLSACLTDISLAQVNTSMPPEARLFYDRAIVSIRPDIKNFVGKKAIHYKKETMNARNLLASLKKDSLLHTIKGSNMEGLAVLILVQASLNIDEEIKNIVIFLRKNPGQDILKETQVLADYKSYLAREVEQILHRNAVLGESVLNNLR